MPPKELSFSSRTDAGGSPAPIESEAIVASLTRAYDAADAAGLPRPPLTELYNFLRNEQGFAKLTMAMLKSAEKAYQVQEEERRIQAEEEAIEAAQAEELAAEFDNHAVAEHCKCHGQGLQEATVRQMARFQIDAHDSHGHKKTTGGDIFFVAIRGPSKTRAKVTDNDDGTYHVDWKPSCSGTYNIAVSMFGVLLPGAPFTVTTSTTAPCAARCIVRGDGLHNASSRATQIFEILFKDKHGAIAPAVEIDVFVEPLPPGSPRARRPPSEQEEAALAEEQKKAAEAAEKERRKREKQEAREARLAKNRRRSTEDSKLTAAAAQAANAEAAEPSAEGDAQNSEQAKQQEEKPIEQQVPSRHRTIRVRVGQQPLIVRSGFGKDSTELGRLLPGQVATVVEERIPDTGEVRACVSLDSLTRAMDGLSFEGAVGESATSFRSIDGSRPTALTTKTPPRVRTPRRPGSTSPRRPLSARESSQSPLGGLGGRRSSGSGSSSYRQSSNLASEPTNEATMVANPFGYGRAAAQAAIDKAAAEAEAARRAKAEAEAARVEAVNRAKAAETAARREAFMARRALINGASPSQVTSYSRFGNLAEVRSGRNSPPGDTPRGTPGSTPAAATSTSAGLSPGSGSGISSGTRSARHAWSATTKGSPIRVGSPMRALALAAMTGASSPAPTPAPSLPPGHMGWVTLVKSGKKLVSSHIKLTPGSRRQYLGQWQRRRANDKTEQISGHLAKTISHELLADPTGIGFAFGGVDPGILHAHGALHEVHKVSYSIGLAGDFLLHVRLRTSAAAIPGSPFRLHVSPGPAHAKRTYLSTEPLRGLVGQTSDSGCHLTFHAADRMGNLCTAGGAKLKVFCASEDVECSFDDHNDGTYTLNWLSKLSGTFTTRVTIDNLDVINSPREFTLTSSTPELTQSQLSGEGLTEAVAGRPATLQIKFLDSFGNTAIPGDDYQFFISMQKEKDKLANVTPHEFEGVWEEDDTGIYIIKYTGNVAGQSEMHVWCENATIKAERMALPGSPFHVTIAPGNASPAVSVVDGWSKLHNEDKHDRGASPGKNDKSIDVANTLFASDTVCFRPQIFDQFSNLTTLPEGAFAAVHTLPDGTVSDLPLSQSTKLGNTTYEIRHTTSQAGEHSVNLTLFGQPIVGSPVEFRVLPDKPDPAFSKLTPPEEEILYTEGHYACKLKTYDRFGNECLVGGLQVSARLQLQKQGVHDQTTLVPTNHSYDVKDCGNGEYLIQMQVLIPCAFKVIVNMDKNLPSGGGELPPVSIHIVADPNAAAKDDKQSPSITPSAPPPKKKSGDKAITDKIKAAAGEVIQGFGLAEERREKDALLIAAEAFADGSKTFGFDGVGQKIEDGKNNLRGSKEGKSKSKGGETGAGAGTGSTPVSANSSFAASAAPLSAGSSLTSSSAAAASGVTDKNGLFDKTGSATPSNRRRS